VADEIGELGLHRYTFCMVAVAWMLGVLIAAGFGYATWRAYGQWVERQRAAEERMASFVAQAKMPATQAVPAAQATPAAVAVPAPSTPTVQEQLLLDAAAKAALAGEPVLAIQLYARLLSRYPQTSLAAQARAAVAEQKKKVAKA
jgi:predicted outer membrane lipoprotein